MKNKIVKSVLLVLLLFTCFNTSFARSTSIAAWLRDTQVCRGVIYYQPIYKNKVYLKCYAFPCERLFTTCHQWVIVHAN